jgi:hypothetical protein
MDPHHKTYMDGEYPKIGDLVFNPSLFVFPFLVKKVGQRLSGLICHALLFAQYIT